MFFRINQILFILATALSTGWSLPDGANEKACGDMLPQHGVAAQTSKFPYEVKVEKASDSQLKIQVI